MKPIIATLIFAFFCHSVFAQKPSKLDSLKNVLAHLPAEGKSFAGDTLRVRVLCEMGEELFKSDSALMLSEIAIKISTKYQFINGLAKAHFIHARRLKKKFFLFKSEEELFKSLSYSLKTSDYELIGFTYLNIGDIYNISNKTNEAISYYEKADNYFKKANSKMGVLYFLNNIAIAYFRQKKIDLSEKYHIECYKKCLEFKNKEFLPNCFVNLGNVAELKRNYSKAIYFYNYSLNDFDNKNRNLKEAYGAAYEGLSSVNLKLGKLENSKSFALKGLSLGVDISNSSYINISKILIQIYEKQKEFDKAFQLSQNLIKKIDQQNLIEIERKLKTAQFEYDLQKQTEENIIIQSKSRWMTISLLLLSIGTSFIIWNLLQIKKKNVEITNQKELISDLNFGLETKILARTTELRIANEELIQKNDEITEALFKGQTIERKRLASVLHNNLGSTLSALKWRLGVLNTDNLNHKEKTVYQGIKDMMDNAYADVRNISHNLLPAEFESKGLIGALTKLIDDLNGSNKLKIIFEFIGEFENLDKKLCLEVYSIAMELINNILKHANATEATIYLENNEGLTLIVADNGTGITQENIKSGSFGLTDIQSRISNLNGTVKFLNNGSKGLTIQLRIASC